MENFFIHKTAIKLKIAITDSHQLFSPTSPTIGQICRLIQRYLSITQKLTMDPDIDGDVAEINAAAEGGRGQGLDWEPSLTFETGKEVSASLIDTSHCTPTN